MLPPGLETPRQVKAYYEERYDAYVDSGEYLPFIYPWATLGAFLCLVYLLFDHRKSPTLRALRLPAFGVLVAFSAWSILNMKARSAPAAYGVGLISAWGTLWTSSLMFFNDCQTDFKRLERADEPALRKTLALTNGTESEHEKLPTAAKKLAKKAALQSSETYATLSPSQRTGPFFWQAYPSHLSSRLDWLLDLFCNFRGIGWSFQTTGIPKPPKHIELQLLGYDSLQSSSDPIKTVSHTGITRFSSRQAVLRYIFPRLILSTIALDVVKALMHRDAYFWGYTDVAVPPAWLPISMARSAILVRSYRLLLSFAGITIALNCIFRLGPLFFCFILGPQRIGIRGEAFLNPVDFFGNFSLVFEKGLAGWWGGFWHQTFRFAFEAPVSRLLEFVKIDKRSQSGKLIGLMVAFGLSGCLHACGSYTQLGDTRPFRGPFSFFALQAVGIVLQLGIARQMKVRGTSAKIPSFLSSIGNFAFTMLWLYWTAPLLVDDFAKGGVWLYEPLAISPLRIMGFGAKDDNGWDLWYGLVFWRTGKGWLDTGLAF